MDTDLLYLQKLLENNQLPFMEMNNSEDKDIDLSMKVYFPKIIVNVCKIIDKEFPLENKDNLIIRRDDEGFHKIDISFTMNDKKKVLRVHSMLHHTWGIVNKV
jgi:hypothetical protein